METIDEELEGIPIDILENMRGRSVYEHVSDEAVGREIERRFVVLFKIAIYRFIIGFIESPS